MTVMCQINTEVAFDLMEQQKNSNVEQNENGSSANVKTNNKTADNAESEK